MDLVVASVAMRLRGAASLVQRRRTSAPAGECSVTGAPSFVHDDPKFVPSPVRARSLRE
jgi:hypothetical protein